MAGQPFVNTELGDITLEQYQELMWSWGGDLDGYQQPERADNVEDPNWACFPDLGAQEQCLEFLAPPTGLNPCMTDWAGPHNFSVEVTCDQGRSQYDYSPSLKFVYVTIGTIMMANIKCNMWEPGLRVRTLPVFIPASSRKMAVHRCVVCIDADPGQNPSMRRHVLRIELPTVEYVEDCVSFRLSAVALLERPQPGTDTVSLPIKFACKTSCSGGMNRRPVAVIFTLEKQNGDVVGRSRVNFRICSCPRRDRKKEEASGLQYGESEDCQQDSEDRPAPRRPRKVARRSVDTAKTTQVEQSSEVVQHPTASVPSTAAADLGTETDEQEHMFSVKILGREHFREVVQMLLHQLVGRRALLGQELSSTEQRLVTEYRSILQDIKVEDTERQ